MIKNNASKSNESSILQLISEAGMLKRVERSGWSVLGIKNAESVADHSFRCSVIGYVLSRMEGIEPYKTLIMTMFNDIHEARITDLHKMAQRYVKIGGAEDASFREQVGSLPPSMKEELLDLRVEYRKQKSKESIVARDADILECLIQAKEYVEHGFREASKFMKKAPRFLETKSARNLWRLAKRKKLNDWWFELTEFTRL